MNLEDWCNQSLIHKPKAFECTDCELSRANTTLSVTGEAALEAVVLHASPPSPLRASLSLWGAIKAAIIGPR